MGVKMLTQDRLKEVLGYDPATGIFTRKIDVANQKAGDVAGNVAATGYRRITIDYKSYYAHHLAVLFMTGSLPPKKSHTDHKNHNEDDNWWSNLTVTTASRNIHNRRGLNKNNTIGICGLKRQKNGRFTASLMVNRKSLNIGTFDTIAEAALARENFKKGLRLG